MPSYFVLVCPDSHREPQAFYECDSEQVAKELIKLFQLNNTRQGSPVAFAPRPESFKLIDAAKLDLTLRVTLRRDVEVLRNAADNYDPYVSAGSKLTPLIGKYLQAQKWERLIRDELGIGKSANEGGNAQDTPLPVAPADFAGAKPVETTPPPAPATSTDPKGGTKAQPGLTGENLRRIRGELIIDGKLIPSALDSMAKQQVATELQGTRHATGGGNRNLGWSIVLRTAIWVVMVAGLECVVVLCAREWGEGQNLWQRVTKSWEWVLAVFAVCALVYPFLLGRERWRLISFWKGEDK